MPIIAFGLVDKKLLLIVLVTVVRTINLLIENELTDGYANSYLCSLEEEIGPIIASFIIYYFFKNKQKNTNEKTTKKFKYIIFLFILRLIKSCYEKIYPYVNKNQYYKYNAILNTVNGVEIILMTIGTYFLLKYKYYIHHMISMILFCILGISMDFILQNYFIIRYNYVVIYIFYIINEVLLFCYIKYMMDKLYFHYIEVIFLWGICGFIVKILIFTGLCIYEAVEEIDGILDGVYTYFAETNAAIIIFVQFVYYIIDPAIYNSLIILMLYYLKPNHMIITDEIHVYLGLIFYKDKPNKYYTLIPFAFQVLALLFYFEILEFNFCDLNQNTIKNIQIREGKEIETKQTYDSTIELGDQYYLRDEDRKSNMKRLSTVSSEDKISNNTDNNLGLIQNKNKKTDYLDFEIIN